MDFRFTEVFLVDGQLIVADSIEEAIQLAIMYNILDDGYNPTEIKRISADYPCSYKVLIKSTNNTNNEKGTENN